MHYKKNVGCFLIVMIQWQTAVKIEELKCGWADTQHDAVRCYLVIYLDWSSQKPEE